MLLVKSRWMTNSPTTSASAARGITAKHFSFDHLVRVLSNDKGTVTRTGSMSQLGQTQKSGCSRGKSALPSITDIVSQAHQVRKVPITDLIGAIHFRPLRSDFGGSSYRYLDGHWRALPQGAAHGRARLGPRDKIAKLVLIETISSDLDRHAQATERGRFVGDTEGTTRVRTRFPHSLQATEARCPAVQHASRWWWRCIRPSLLAIASLDWGPRHRPRTSLAYP